MAEEAKVAKNYTYIVLLPAASAVEFKFLGEFEGRSPEQAVEAALAAKAIPSDLTDGPMKGGVIAIPASKWYVVEFEGEKRIDYSFTRGGGDTDQAEAVPAEAAPEPPVEAAAAGGDAPAPPDLSPEDEQGLKRL